jgi:large subunit ribosomal protein LP0
MYGGSATEGLSKQRQKKSAYMQKLVGLLQEYRKLLVVECDNVSSSHMQNTRKLLRGQAVILMGKNTLMRKAIRLYGPEMNPDWLNIIPAIKNNVGLVFTNGDLSAVRDILTENKIPAAAKINQEAPCDVIVPKGPTGLEPTKTSFLQALNIGSKINRGQIEILADVHLINKGERVGGSEVTLLNMLSIKPFFYGLIVTYAYDSGSLFEASILDITPDVIISRFFMGLNNLAALSLELNIPTVAALPHVVLNGYKNLLAVVAETNYVFEQAEQLKAMLENPDAFVVVEEKTEVVEEEEPEDEEPEDEESSMSGMGGMFGGSDSDDY